MISGFGMANAIRILVVDDDRLILHTLAAGLRDAGYEVIAADEGESALRLCQEARPDLALLDIRLPGMSGPRIAEQLQQLGTVPIMFLSAYSDADLVESAVAAGALGYLVKPLDVVQIIPSIEAALARAADISSLKQAEANLSRALDSSRATSVAIGLIMERYRLSPEDAFEMLRSYARGRREKVAEAAARIVEAGAEIDLLPQVSPKTK
jgi:AmiR/NasT family two-component response regulator